MPDARARALVPGDPPPIGAEASAADSPASGIKKKSKTKRAKDVVGALGSVAKLAGSLEDILADRSGAPGATKRKANLGLKARAKLISAETERFSAVLQHAEFQANPFETIERHLLNSAAAQLQARAAAAARGPAADAPSASQAKAPKAKPKPDRGTPDRGAKPDRGKPYGGKPDRGKVKAADGKGPRQRPQR
jgi:hypothetical protein